MRVLIAEHDHPVYAQLLREAAPDLEVLTSGDSAELASQAADCPVWPVSYTHLTLPTN